ERSRSGGPADIDRGSRSECREPAAANFIGCPCTPGHVASRYSEWPGEVSRRPGSVCAILDLEHSAGERDDPGPCGGKADLRAVPPDGAASDDETVGRLERVLACRPCQIDNAGTGEDRWV